MGEEGEREEVPKERRKERRKEREEEGVIFLSFVNFWIFFCLSFNVPWKKK